MALTLVEQLLLSSGAEAPTSFTLIDAVTHATAIQGTTFYQTHDDPGGSTDAQSYISKYLALVDAAFISNERVLRELTRLMIVQIGEAATNLAQVQGATDTQWANFVQSNINEVIEIAAGITQDEKTAYDAL